MINNSKVNGLKLLINAKENFVTFPVRIDSKEENIEEILIHHEIFRKAKNTTLQRKRND